MDIVRTYHMSPNTQNEWHLCGTDGIGNDKQ